MRDVVGTAEVRRRRASTPDPAPPPVDSPKPWPRAPVSATRCPARVSRASRRRPAARLVGRLLHVGAAACRLGRLRVRHRHRHLRRLRAPAAGPASRFGASGGVAACTGRPPIDVMPPFSGPPLPPPSVIVMTVGGVASRCESQRRRRDDRIAPTSDDVRERSTRRPSAAGRPARCIRSRRTSVTSTSASRPAAWRRCRRSRRRRPSAGRSRPSVPVAARRRRRAGTPACRRCVSHLLADALLQHVDADLLVAEVDDVRSCR